MEGNILECNGLSLTINKIHDFCRNPEMQFEISDSNWQKIENCRQFVDELAKEKVAYGINTGFGPMCSHIIAKDDIEALQHNLVRSHAVGMGKPLPPDYILAAMLVRLNTIIKGHSGITPDLAKHFQKYINSRILPIIPEHGGVGASGDLVQLAHIALGLIGEGKCYYKNKIHFVSEVLQQENITPHTLQAKEGLALINGTSLMAGIGSLLSIDAIRLLDLAVKTSAWSLELVQAYTDSFAEKLHEVRPFVGQNKIAERLRTLLGSSQQLTTRSDLQSRLSVPEDAVEIVPDDVQQVYSLRCAPQILGPIYDNLANVISILETDINSVTDNPVIDYEAKQTLHGGNFHGDYVAMAMDQLKSAMVRLTMVSERRVNFFMHDRINKKFPPFLNRCQPGLTLGLQGLQFVATSTTALAKSMAYPHMLHSIPTNMDNQDIVSLGTDAALMTRTVIDHAYTVLAIELVTLAQASDCMGSKSNLSDSSRVLYEFTRNNFAELIDDRSFTDELNQLTMALRKTEILLKHLF